MRLKTLFFPIVLVISIFIFIGFIIPEISYIRTQQNEKIAKTEELSGVRGKQESIQAMSKDVSGNINTEKTINSYLPSIRSEERIIGGLNFLASDAGVSFNSIKIEENKTPDVSVSGIPGQDDQSKKNSLQLQTVKISLVGEYDKIRIFLSNVQRMSIFNNIKAVSISKKKDGGSTTQPSEGQETSDSRLSAEISVEFGYLPLIKMQNRSAEDINMIIKSGIDKKSIDLLAGYISENSKAADINALTNNDAKGKSNPFFN